MCDDTTLLRVNEDKPGSTLEAQKRSSDQHCNGWRNLVIPNLFLLCGTRTDQRTAVMPLSFCPILMSMHTIVSRVRARADKSINMDISNEGVRIKGFRPDRIQTSFTYYR